jgi:AcrR family transcriptional regulator
VSSVPAEGAARTNPKRAPSGPASRLGLSRDKIVRAARDLLDREGLSALSMRRLADDLGIGTMTLYGYFRSKEELLDAVVDLGGEEIGRAVPAKGAGGEWRPQMRSLMIGIREALGRHPAIVELRRARPLLSPGALSVTEAGMRILREAGFSHREAGRVYRILFVYTFGFSAFGPRPGSTAERDLSIEALSGLPADRYPTLVEGAREASDSMADETLYERGLDALLAGFDPDEAIAAPRGGDPEAPGAV